MENNTEEIKEHFRRVIKLCKNRGNIGMNLAVDNFYVTFGFEPKKEKCKECGKIKD